MKLATVIARINAPASAIGVENIEINALNPPTSCSHGNVNEKLDAVGMLCHLLSLRI